LRTLVPKTGDFKRLLDARRELPHIAQLEFALTRAGLNYSERDGRQFQYLLNLFCSNWEE